MKYWRIFIAGVVVTVFGTAVGWITCGWLFNWVYKIEPTNIWRRMDTIPVAYYQASLALNIVLAFVYALLVKGIPGKNKLIKGLVFGLIMWLFMGLRPAILNAIQLYHQYAIPQALSHLFSTGIAYGLLIGYLYKKE